MRHNKKLNHLGRTSSHRKAMLSNMAASLIMHKRITTTIAKAKALRVYIEPIVTRSKEVAGQTPEQATHMRRMTFKYLQNKFAVTELFAVIGPKVGERPGGYTRILKTGHRYGDGADMCIIELVDFNENMLSASETAKKATRRTRRGAKKAGEDVQVAKKDVVVSEEKADDTKE
jgi:large subunit ribosomal protein L17